MRFVAPVLSLLAAVALAQQSTCNTNCILVPNTGLSVQAGQPYALTWSNPSSGQITIKLQPSVDVTPTSGITLASNVNAATGKYTVQIPSNLVNSNQYTFEIIDQANPSNINFSPTFAIAGATGVSTAVSSTGTASSSASTRTSSSSGSLSASSSSSSITGSSSASTSSTSATRTSSDSSTRTSSSATSTATTAAPNSNTNGASSLKIEGALVALVAGVMAAF